MNKVPSRNEIFNTYSELKKEKRKAIKAIQAQVRMAAEIEILPDEIKALSNFEFIPEDFDNQVAQMKACLQGRPLIPSRALWDKPSKVKTARNIVLPVKSKNVTPEPTVGEDPYSSEF